MPAGRATRYERDAKPLDSRKRPPLTRRISARHYADVERGTRSVSLEVACRIAAGRDTKLQSILDIAD